MSVEVRELSKIYGEQRAVDGISFSVHSGEIVGFLGPNGAGKSTTMKMLACYILPDAGEARIMGRDIYEESLEVRRNIGYLPEHNPLYPDMYVREYLTFIAGVHKYQGNIRQRVDELVELTGLSRERHKKIGMLSKGYRQRVGLSQALLHNPPVLILDEPTTGLDPNQIVEIRNLIADIGKEKTVIFSTHILQEVQAICNRVLIINLGKLVADNPTEELMQRFAGKIYLRLNFLRPIDAEVLRRMEGVEDVLKKPDHYLLRIRGGGRDIREEIFRYAVRTDNVLLEMSQEVQSLENVFQALTSGTSASINPA